MGDESANSLVQIPRRHRQPGGHDALFASYLVGSESASRVPLLRGLREGAGRPAAQRRVFYAASGAAASSLGSWKRLSG
jgi:hypothetical protein